MFEALDGALTEYDYSDDDSDGKPTYPSQGNKKRQDAGPFSRKEKARQRDTRRRRFRRTKNNTEGAATAEPPVMKGVNKTRRAACNGLELDFDTLACIEVTRPGWVGKPLQGLPERIFGKEELEREYGMAFFEWDGLCVLSLCIVDFYSRVHTGCPTCYWIESNALLELLPANLATSRAGALFMTTRFLPSNMQRLK